MSGGNEAICAGLYTYAVEEYGKVLLLKQYSPSAGKINIEFRDIFRRHKRKFKIATKNLPTECTILRRGIFNAKIFNPKTFDTAQVIADLEARMAVFYCDFVDSGDAIKPVPQVSKELLMKAIKTLQTKAFEI